MISKSTFDSKMATLKACLPGRQGTLPEWSKLTASYDLAFTKAKLEEVDFIEACDRILFTDEWFPTIARVIAVTDECARDRRQRGRRPEATSNVRRIVCAYCHGARWVRFGGYDANGTTAGDAGSRVQACPRCTTGGKYDAKKEALLLAEEGGVPDPNDTGFMPDMSKTTWRLPRLADGRPDMGELYRQARVLRGLDPNVDERVRPVGGWSTLGMVLSGSISDVAMTPPDPALVGAGSDPWDDGLTF